MLKGNNISKSFGDVKVLDNINLEFKLETLFQFLEDLVLVNQPCSIY